jgi:hypothetical protein
MKRIVLAGALALAAIPALAQEPSPDIARQVEQTQARMFAAQADYYLAVAKQLQQRLADSASQAAAKDRYWAEYVAGLIQAPK